MNNYLEFNFNISPLQPWNEILMAELIEIGFDSFTEEHNGILAYIQKDLFDDKQLQEINMFSNEAVEISYTYQEMPNINWNEEWEKNFEPINVENQVSIRAEFHSNQNLPHEIIIQPKMSFGTGHHATTYLMIQQMLDMNFENKTVLDMGCGTSILAILARMRGARPCTAIDIDEWCVRNSIENIELNHVDDIAVSQGDASSLTGKGPFDVIIANINRNILLNDMKQYVACMHTNSELYMSGFYIDDIAAIREEAEKNGLAFIHYKEKNRWAEVKFIYKG